MKRFNLRYKLLVLTAVALGVWGLAVNLPFTFKAGEIISAEQMNQTLEALNEGKQERVGGSCAAGSSIRSIDDDGTVACEVDDVGAGGGAGVDAINGMTGAVTLQAGENVTIDDSTAGQIRISAASGAGGNQHDHFGQTWTGEDATTPGLTVVNTAPDQGGAAALVARVGDSAGTLGLNATGVWGEVPSGAGVAGSSAGGWGVYGQSGSNRGVYGQSQSGYGVYGQSSSGSGVYGMSADAGAYGVFGVNTGGTAIKGETSGGIGVWGKSDTRGVVGTLGGSSCPGSYGVGGCAASGNGVVGKSGSGYGVYGASTDGNGMRGDSTNGIGVWGNSQTRGVVGTLGSTSCAGTYAVGGCAASGVGVYGYSASNDAVVGVTATGNTTNAAIAGSSDNGYAAYFEAGLGVGQGYAVCSFKAGTTGWACSSDRALKENFQAVDAAEVLEAIAAMPITTWNLKGSAVRQLGPTSQDFYAAFGLGSSDTSINTTDAQGVALAAIQGLYQVVREQRAEITALEARLAALEGAP